MRINVNFKILDQKINVGFKDLQTLTEQVEHESYQGSYNITPTRNRQVLDTASKIMLQDLIVEPIPQNYGLITYNGFEIMVS